VILILFFNLPAYKMKSFFKILFFITEHINFSFASQPVSSYFNSTDSGSTHSTHQLFVGFNATRLHKVPEGMEIIKS